jgi:capsid protein
VIDIKNFHGFVTANIQSLRARANIAYVVEGTTVDPFNNGVTADEELQEINGTFVHYLNNGESIKALDSSTTPINFSEFVESTVRMIAVARNVSYELAFRDFSRVNFSSARASLIQDNKRFDTEQRHIIDYVLAPIFWAWYEVEELRGNVPSKKPTLNWITPVREWVKPTEDLKVTLDLIDRNLKTYTEAAKERGMDFEELLKMRQEEEKMIKKYQLQKEEA